MHGCIIYHINWILASAKCSGWSEIIVCIFSKMRNKALTSKLHVRNNDFLTDTGQCSWILKQVFIRRPLCDRGQKLYSIAHELKSKRNPSVHCQWNAYINKGLIKLEVYMNERNCILSSYLWLEISQRLIFFFYNYVLKKTQCD